jgi:hypothetical protein
MPVEQKTISTAALRKGSYLQTAGLAADVKRHQKKGWRVVSMNEYMAVLERETPERPVRRGNGGRGRILLHVCLTILTPGLWLPVWAYLAWRTRTRASETGGL